MKDNKGQALVEFVLIVPILIFILLALIDIGNVIINKYKLEDNLSTIVELYQNNKHDEINTLAENKGIVVSYTTIGSYTTIKLKKNVVIMTPGLNNILGHQMILETERAVYNE